MAGEPLALCVKHPEPIIHRVTVPCPLCAAEQRIAELEKQVKEFPTKKR